MLHNFVHSIRVSSNRMKPLRPFGLSRYIEFAFAGASRRDQWASVLQTFFYAERSFCTSAIFQQNVA